MSRYSAKIKIYGALFFWFMLTVSMASFGFGVVEKSTLELNRKYSDQMLELNMLKSESLSFNLSKSDLEDLRSKPLQPEDFFSRDETLVNEIKFLEDLTKKLNLEYGISGISGTVKSAGKAKASTTGLITIPYSISISGSFDSVSAFIKTMENLPFANQISSVNMGVVGENKVSASFSAAFYIRK